MLGRSRSTQPRELALDLRLATAEPTLDKVRSLSLFALALLIAGCDASTSDPARSSPSPSSSTAVPTDAGRRDAAACLMLGHVTTWPVESSTWNFEMGDVYYKAFDRDLKAVVREAYLDASTDSHRIRLMHQAMQICRAWGAPLFGPRSAEATEGDIEACATLRTVTSDLTWDVGTNRLLRASHQADDFYLLDSLEHLFFGFGDPKTNRLIDEALERCGDIHADEPIASPSG